MSAKEKKIILIGGIGRPGEFGGELTKNKLIAGRLEELGYKVIGADTAGASRHPWRLLRIPAALLRGGRRAPVIFSTSFANVRPIVKALGALNPGRRLVYWVIGGNLADRIANGPYRPGDFNPFSHILVEGKKMVEDLSALGLRGLRHVPNFKQLTFMPDAKDKRIAPREGLRCVFFSRIIPEKGVGLILDACERLKERGLTVDFYGEIDPAYRQEFLSRIDSLDNAAYRGTLDFFNPSGLQTLSGYHLTLFPTYWRGEGFPGVVVDSLAASVPILASRWNLNEEVLPQGCGFFCEPRDGESLISALTAITDNPERLNPMFARCAEEAARFDVRNVITPQLCNDLFH